MRIRGNNTPLQNIDGMALLNSNNNADDNNLHNTTDVDKALQQLIEAGYGSHFLLTYPDTSIFTKISTRCAKKYLKDDNSLVLIIPFYETTAQVKQHLLIEMTDLEQYEKDRSLVIIDSIKAYFSEIGLMTFIDGLLKHAKATGKSGLSVLADMGSFHHLQKIHQLVEHEISLPARYNARLRGYCIYHQENFDQLTKQQRQSIFEHHEKNLLITI